MTRLVLAGCGNMGYAMLHAWISKGVAERSDVAVVEPAEALRSRAMELGVTAVEDPDQIPGGFDPSLVVFAVKPQIMTDVLPVYRRFAQAGATCMSIAAGTNIGIIESILGAKTPVVRCMPNTPAAIGKGMMVLYANAHTSNAARQEISNLLGANGRVEWINDEGLMDAVTAVSGSGPAYVFYFMECLAAAGESAGLPAETAATLAMQTVYGAACLAFESDTPPAKLREQVTSPNGTTAAALNILMGDERLKNLVADAVEAARLRSIELG